MTDTSIIDDQPGAVTRRLHESTRDGAPTRVATLRQRYDTTVEDLWDACTSAERIPRWFAPVTGDLRAGGTYQIEGNASGTIESCEPPRSFAATWEFGGGVSWIAVRIDPDGDGARLTLEHTAPAEDTSEFWQRYGPGAVGVGWDLALLGLTLHVATGERVTGPDTFHTTPEGRRFITATSAAWGEANVEAGTPRQAAEAARDNTTAFYLGEEQPGG